MSNLPCCQTGDALGWRKDVRKIESSFIIPHLSSPRRSTGRREVSGCPYDRRILWRPAVAACVSQAVLPLPPVRWAKSLPPEAHLLPEVSFALCLVRVKPRLLAAAVPASGEGRGPQTAFLCQDQVGLGGGSGLRLTLPPPACLQRLSPARQLRACICQEEEVGVEKANT